MKIEMVQKTQNNSCDTNGNGNSMSMIKCIKGKSMNIIFLILNKKHRISDVFLSAK